MGAIVMDRAISVVKVGGSLAGDRARLRAALRRIADGAEGAAVIVPGGGPLADAVRKAQRDLHFDDGLAHRLALDAMGAMGEIFVSLEPRLRVAAGIDAIRDLLARDHVVVWDPVDLRSGRTGIAENWDVTSDSLALWLARSLGAGRCLLLKSAPCPVWTEAAELVELGLVDRAFLEFATAYAGRIEIGTAELGDVAAA